MALPLGRQDSIISIESMQNYGMAPKTVGEDLCFWPSPYFGPKTGLFFFVCSSPNFRKKN